jgi:hypothetical protein
LHSMTKSSGWLRYWAGSHLISWEKRQKQQGCTKL